MRQNYKGMTADMSTIADPDPYKIEFQACLCLHISLKQSGRYNISKDIRAIQKFQRFSAILVGRTTPSKIDKARRKETNSPGKEENCGYSPIMHCKDLSWSVLSVLLKYSSPDEVY
jgi:hypothetical protein